MRRTTGCLLLCVLGGGCANARFEKRYAECTPPAPDAVAIELGVSSSMEAPADFADAAAASYTAAPPWVLGALRAYPQDSSYSYRDLLSSAPPGSTTPLLCEIAYRPAMRQRLGGGTTRRWLSADKFSGADVSVLYEVVGEGPPLRVRGPNDADYVSVLDPTHRFTEDAVLRVVAYDRDRSIDDVLATFEMPYRDPLGMGTGTSVRGSTSVACQHLDPVAVSEARRDALETLDRVLADLSPVLESQERSFGLDDTGMESSRELLMRAASLDRWGDPEIQARADRMLGAQLCFERAALPVVERRAARIRRQLFQSRELEWQATEFACAAATPSPADPAGDPWPAGSCTLAVQVTNHTSIDVDLLVRQTTLVLAGGREVTVTPEGSTHAAAQTTSSLVLRLAPSVTADVRLTRPVLLRQRRWQLLRKEYAVTDHALWPRR